MCAHGRLYGWDCLRCAAAAVARRSSERKQRTERNIAQARDLIGQSIGLRLKS
jgi:hypothetical protein